MGNKGASCSRHSSSWCRRWWHASAECGVYGAWGLLYRWQLAVSWQCTGHRFTHGRMQRSWCPQHSWVVAVVCDHIYSSNVLFCEAISISCFFSDDAMEILIKGGVVAQWWGLRVTIKRSWFQFVGVLCIRELWQLFVTIYTVLVWFLWGRFHILFFFRWSQGNFDKGWHGGTVVGLESYDQEVVSSVSGPCSAQWCNDSGQSGHTHVPL